MTTPPGASVAPLQVQAGITPTDMINPRSLSAHRFLNVLKDVTRASGAYAVEQDLHDALAHIDAYGKHVIDPADHHKVRSEEDAAPVEDVRLRVAPGAIRAMPVPAGGPIDYQALAAAIVAHQRAAANAEAAASEVHQITDVPPAS